MTKRIGSCWWYIRVHLRVILSWLRTQFFFLLVFFTPRFHLLPVACTWKTNWKEEKKMKGRKGKTTGGCKQWMYFRFYFKRNKNVHAWRRPFYFVFFSDDKSDNHMILLINVCKKRNTYIRSRDGTAENNNNKIMWNGTFSVQRSKKKYNDNNNGILQVHW